MRSGIPVIPVTTLPSVLEPNAIYNVAGAMVAVTPDGTPKLIGPIPLQTTLVAGTKAIDLSTGPYVGLVGATSKAIVQVVSPLTATLTVERQVVCTVNTVTITALLAAKTINAADVSIVNVIIFP